MSAPIQKLDELIEVSKRELADAQRLLEEVELSYRAAKADVERIEAELRGLSRARDIVGREIAHRPLFASAARSRSLSLTWQRILKFIASKGEHGATIDEIEAFISGRGYSVQRTAIRSQLSNYKQRGMVETVADAQYKITAQGAEHLG